MKVLYLGIDDAYAVRRLRYEAKRRRIRFDVLPPQDIVLATQGKIQFADVLVVRTQQPTMVSHALTLARLYRARGKRVIDAALATQPVIYSKLNDLLLLAEHGIPVPKTILAPRQPNEQRRAANQIGFPLVVKGIHGAGGERVWLAKKAAQLHRILQREPPGSLMLQEYLEASYDFRVLAVGYRALPILLQRYPKRGDFRTNAQWAGRVEPISLSFDSSIPSLRGAMRRSHPYGRSRAARQSLKVHEIATLPLVARNDVWEIKKLAEASARILKREFTGIDIRCKGRHPLVLEVNRQPEFELFEQKTGLNVAGVFLDYVILRNQVTKK